MGKRKKPRTRGSGHDKLRGGIPELRGGGGRRQRKEKKLLSAYRELHRVGLGRKNEDITSMLTKKRRVPQRNVLSIGGDEGGKVQLGGGESE